MNKKVVFICGLLLACSNGTQDIDYRQEMRDFVIAISTYARGISPGFIVIPQNGQELLTDNGESSGTFVVEYTETIDGHGREDLYYGYNGDDQKTPQSEIEYLTGFLDRAEQHGIEVLVTDYCSTQTYVDSSFAANAARGYVSFAADARALNSIPAYPVEPYNVNSEDILSLAQARNFLYLINPETYASKQECMDSLSHTNFDILIIDLYFDADNILTNEDITTLQMKSNGGQRLVIAYCSIGEAEDYRFYWQPQWETDPPAWLGQENPNWPGNYLVRFWELDWQDIVFGNDASYMKKILDAGFDGVYLDIIDAFEYFENR